MTAEEFIREKIREKQELRGEMQALWKYSVSGEDCLRWAHEYAELAALSPAKQEQPKERFCGCRSGEDCNADCVVPAWIAKRVLAARDAHIKGDHDEVWHQLYSIAHPDFDTLSKDTWKDLEEMAKGAALPYTEEPGD